ncbi:MAG: lipocalin-like domain-containing protein [Betaproteobacteria bacterium]|nr:lipocalin-like domain-containing protein [Betaproteobacteria bacterium]
MNRSIRELTGVLPVLAAFVGAMLSGASGAWAQQQAGEFRQQLIGTWTVSAVTIEQGGTKRETFGPEPKGFMTLNPDGRYSITLMRSDLPKIASNNREAGTPEENKAIAAGILAHFGTYSVNEKDRTIKFHIEASTFPNWNGANQDRPITSLTADELKWTVPTPTQGSGTAYLVWKRAK